MSRLPAHRRLRALPDVFTTKTLAAHLEGNAKVASVLLSRWRAEGLIRSLGPRVGVHFNLLRKPDAEDTLKLDAIAWLFPGAVIAGASAVHAAGWTTQIPSALEIMVPDRRSLPEIEGCRLSTRPLSWFDKAPRLGSGNLPMISPAFALADLWVSGDWRAEPDDLEWDLIDMQDLRAAFAVFGEEIPAHWVDEARLEDRRLE